MRDASRRSRHSRVVSTVRKLRPKALTPRLPVYKRLSEADRDTLKQLLTEPTECVYDASFRLSTLPDSELEASVAAQPPMPAQSAAAALVPGPATEVLTADEEHALFLRFNYCRHRVMRILQRYRGRRLDAAATSELLCWNRLAQEKRAQIVRWNTSLVLAMARRSRNSGVELPELVSEGNLALLRCVDKFDAARGYKFSTYACRAILASFSRIAAKTARYRTQFPTPYDSAMDRSDYLDRKRERIELECVDELRRVLFENAADLNSVERRVLDARFALDQPAERAGPGGRRKTLDQVGALLGVSKERVRQIQNQAMGKLRAALEQRLLAAS